MEDTPVKPMPRMLVLNYMTRGSRPRSWETGIAVLYAAALLALLFSVILLWSAAKDSYDSARWAYPYTYTGPAFWSGPFPPPGPPIIPVTISRWLEEFFTLEQSWWGIGLLTLGTCFLVSAIGLQRGSRRAARFAAWAFVPIVLALAFVSAMLLVVGSANALGSYGTNRPWLSLLLIPGFLFLVVTLLAVDVHRTLRWAARNPLGEVGNRMSWLAKGQHV